MKRLITKHDRKVDIFFHDVSRTIIKWCTKNKIDTVVMGHNKNWKVHINLRKRVNQILLHIKVKKLLQDLEEFYSTLVVVLFLLLST